jgi:hypothetical protein
MNNFYLAIKILATVALFTNRIILGHIGPLAGAIDGAILYAIWVKK